MIEMTALELNKYITDNPNTVLIDVRESWESVSYTHLKLPTNDVV